MSIYKISIIPVILITLTANGFASDYDNELAQKSRGSSHSSTSSTALTSAGSPQSHESFISYVCMEKSSPRGDFLSEEFLMDLREEAIIDPATLDLLGDAKYERELISRIRKDEIEKMSKRDILGVLCVADHYFTGKSFLKQHILTAVSLYKWVVAQENTGDDWSWQITAMQNLRKISKENGYEKAIRYWQQHIDQTIEAHDEELRLHSEELERQVKLVADETISSE